MGGAELFSSPAMAALGIGMLQLCLLKRSSSYHRLKSYVYLLLSQARDRHIVDGQRLVAHRLFSVPGLRGSVRVLLQVGHVQKPG